MPEEDPACEHPAPYVGVLAHTFGHYAEAEGPEGTRRTVTHFGPVIGGRPVRAWHCEDCGLLRLDYPDGRKEELKLYPGPQPGLLAHPTQIIPEAIFMGRQAHVSGVTAPQDLYQQLVESEEPAPVAKKTGPKLGWFTGSIVALLTLTCLMLLVDAYLAVSGYQTSDLEGETALFTVLLFGLAAALALGRVSFQHFFPMPTLSPSISVTSRGKPSLDFFSATVVTFLVVVAICLLIAGIGATYDYSTAAWEWIPLYLALGSFGIAFVTGLGGFVVHRAKK